MEMTTDELVQMGKPSLSNLIQSVGHSVLPAVKRSRSRPSPQQPGNETDDPDAQSACEPGRIEVPEPNEVAQRQERRPVAEDEAGDRQGDGGPARPRRVSAGRQRSGSPDPARPGEAGSSPGRAA